MPNKSKTFVILGASSWKYYFNRGGYFAIELAKKGYKVFFIEEMPSVASRLKYLFNNPFRNIETVSHPNLIILTPPICFTFFRSSYLPIIDRFQLKLWMEKIILKYNLDNSILLYTFPYWRSLGIIKSLFNAECTIFDIADDVEMFSRNKLALRRMELATDILRNESDIILYSSNAMEKKYSLTQTNCNFISNGVSDKYFEEEPVFLNNKNNIKDKIKIGFIGNFDNRTLDIQLIHTLSNINNFKIEICGAVNMNQQKLLSNCTFHGFLDLKEVILFLISCDVCIIPFKINNLTSVINPLKLYEYLSLGKPVVAMRTDDLEFYSTLVYLANSESEFIKMINKAINEDCAELQLKRIQFAKKNLWSDKVNEIEKLIGLKIND